MRRRSWCGAAVAAACLAAPAGVSAHIQVSPAQARTGDAVRFSVLVPGERANRHTRRVVLKIPKGVLPFSFGSTPGWKRSVVLAGDGSIDRVSWSGDLASDGFAEFSFLAGMPESPTVISWKALQTYDDGKVVRWIGAPESENPAATTAVTRDAEAQNAGGESASSKPAAKAESEGSGADWLARGLGLAALGVAVAVAASIARRPGRSSCSDRSDGVQNGVPTKRD